MLFHQEDRVGTLHQVVACKVGKHQVHLMHDAATIGDADLDRWPALAVVPPVRGGAPPMGTFAGG